MALGTVVQNRVKLTSQLTAVCVCVRSQATQAPHAVCNVHRSTVRLIKFNWAHNTVISADASGMVRVPHDPAYTCARIANRQPSQSAVMIEYSSCGGPAPYRRSAR